MPVLGPHQMMPQQNTMDRESPAAISPSLSKQGVQLACSPVRPLLPQLQHPLPDIRPCSGWDYGAAAGSFPPPPRYHQPRTFATTCIGRPRNLNLFAQPPQALLASAGPHHKTHPLLVYIHHIPHAILPLLQGLVPSPSLSQSVKDVMRLHTGVTVPHTRAHPITSGSPPTQKGLGWRPCDLQEVVHSI